MGSNTYSDDFKRDAVAQITERGYPVREVSDRLGVSAYSLYAWNKKFAKAALADAEPTDDRCGSSSLAHGHMARKAQGKSSDPFGPRQPFHQHGLGGVPPGPQSGALDEPPRKLP